MTDAEDPPAAAWRTQDSKGKLSRDHAKPGAPPTPLITDQARGIVRGPLGM